jgi:ubiquinone/menaquinone biosynthesis C-methylase UbiE
MGDNYMADDKKIHKHGGKSSSAVLSASEVLKNVNLKSGDIFLDAGSGDGFISLEASGIVGENGKVFAVDVHEPSMAILRQKIEEKDLKNLNPVLADITSSIPVEDNSIDLYLTANVFHGIVGNAELDSTMKEINRVLKDDGVLAVVEFIKEEGMPGPPMDVRLEPQDVLNNIEKYGFEEKEVKQTGPYHYVVLASKK